ncbi:MAG: 3-deoxy-manno-octulosonate cytidylyltransferase (CMP-KDO synthetase), partial [Neolewinella sp.]
LADMAGKTMVQRVYERVASTEEIDDVVVATDDDRIYDHVLSFGGQVKMTRKDHQSGTDRVAEVAKLFPQAKVIVNVQGDEPFIDPRQIAAVVAPFENVQVAITTLARPITEEGDMFSPNVVKVVRNYYGEALYFSRHAIPYLRDVPIGLWIDKKKHLQHLGLYAYRAEILQQLTTLPKGELEGDESLEQLRWLHAGYTIYVGLTDLPAIGIDTPEDLMRAIKLVE